MNKIKKIRLFNECLEEAILVARKYMPKTRSRINKNKNEEFPFSEEFKLACMLYVKKC
jgi:hypothetical protein